MSDKPSAVPTANAAPLKSVLDTFTDLVPGDFVVHTAHGIAKFKGIETLLKGQQHEEHLQLEFFGGQYLYVPISKIGLVQKYVAGHKTHPKLAKLNSKIWSNQKRTVQEAVFDYAAEMLDLQAQRESVAGTVFPPDSDWQNQFEERFHSMMSFTETPDQITAIADIKNDMCRSRPMDRLLCGDVGFGKTEVAMRAAFKAVDAGYQVAVLVPTTVLADQHCRTFRERMADFPVTIQALSRFQTPQEQKEIIQQCAAGTVDIVIGTHRLVSQDVHFRQLGLVVIDEEQRFGVSHKEKLKQMRTSVDVLTMTATPIPRTLHFSLIGLRDISNLETPPENRKPVLTRVVRWDAPAIREMIYAEIERGGQIYFVHNKVHDITEIAQRVQQIAPECRIGIGHAQMPDGELEDVMLRFINGEYDMLLSTTIIESGLDIPAANTIFIDEADRFGLADLHQLRGRVGRSTEQAYCYLLLPEKHLLNSTAAKRLRVLEDYAHLGSGFHIAMRDLELRGAGNILGTQQSGHIAAVGYEMYCQFLETAVRTLKMQPPKQVVDVELDLPGEALIPRTFIDDQRYKIDIYRRLQRVSTVEECEEMRKEIENLCGVSNVPAEVRRLLIHSKIRVLAHNWRIRKIKLEAGIGNDSGYVVFDYVSQKLIQELAGFRKMPIRLTADRQAYVPFPNALTRNSDPDKLLNFVLKVLGDDSRD